MMKKLSFNTLLSNEWLFLVGITGGMMCGLFFKNFSQSLEPFAQIYMSFLQLSVIPVIIITVTTGLSNITSHPHANDKIWRIFSSLFALLVISAVLSTLIGVIFEPGIGLTKNPAISALIAANENVTGAYITTKDIIVVDTSPNMLKFLVSIVPSNIFSSLSQGFVLQIIVFSIIFGAAMGYKQSKDGMDRSSILKTFFPVFTLMNDTIIKFLPFGVFFLLASQFSSFSFSTILILGKLVFALCLSMTLLITFFVIVICFYAKAKLTDVLRSLAYIGLMAVSTRSAFACIPKCIEGMSRYFDKDMTNLVIPFGNTTCRYGSICFYTIGAIFIANIFTITFSPSAYIAIIFSSILASFAASGAVGILALQMITIVLDPLGLPLGAVFALFVAIDPIIDFFDTLANVYGNCAATAISGRGSQIGHHAKKLEVPVAETV